MPVVDGGPRALPGIRKTSVKFDISQEPLGKEDRQYLGFTAVYIESVAGTTYTPELAFRGPNGGSIDGDGDGSADNDEELSRKHHGVG